MAFGGRSTIFNSEFDLAVTADDEQRLVRIFPNLLLPSAMAEAQHKSSLTKAHSDTTLAKSLTKQSIIAPHADTQTAESKTSASSSVSSKTKVVHDIATQTSVTSFDESLALQEFICAQCKRPSIWPHHRNKSIQTHPMQGQCPHEDYDELRAHLQKFEDAQRIAEINDIQSQLAQLKFHLEDAHDKNHVMSATIHSAKKHLADIRRLDPTFADRIGYIPLDEMEQSLEDIFGQEGRVREAVHKQKVEGINYLAGDIKNMVKELEDYYFNSSLSSDDSYSDDDEEEMDPEMFRNKLEAMFRDARSTSDTVVVQAKSSHSASLKQHDTSNTDRHMYNKEHHPQIKKSSSLKTIMTDTEAGPSDSTITTNRRSVSQETELMMFIETEAMKASNVQFGAHEDVERFVGATKRRSSELEKIGRIGINDEAFRSSISEFISMDSPKLTSKDDIEAGPSGYGKHSKKQPIRSCSIGGQLETSANKRRSNDDVAGTATKNLGKGKTVIADHFASP